MPAVLNELYLYGQAVMNLLSVTYETVAVPHLYATPERAWAQTQTGDTRLPLPIMATSIGNISENQELFNAGRWMMNRNSASGVDIVSYLPPQPIVISYQTNIWARSWETMDSICIALKGKFIKDVAYVNVNLGLIQSGYGTHRFSLIWGGFTNNSDLEPQESERAVRRTMDFTLNCILTRGTKTVKQVLEVGVPVHQSPDPATSSGYEIEYYRFLP
jgi:hypothetical protein